jgi:hypothetical protein
VHDSQVHAAGALCNLGLEFSSVKETVLSSGTLQHLVHMTVTNQNMEIRIQGCLALRNLAYKSDDAFKDMFTKVAGHFCLLRWLREPGVFRGSIQLLWGTCLLPHVHHLFVEVLY